MGRKSDPFKRAALQGYGDDLSQVDNRRVLKPLASSSEKVYQEALDTWSQ